MYNKFLEYLLDNSPERCISKAGVTVRRLLGPIIRLVIPFTTPTKLTVVRRAKMPHTPVIFAASHGFKEDVEDTLLTAGRQAYILIGSLTQIFKSFQGISAWAAGTVLVDRLDKASRRASKRKMIRALNLGASVIVFPEGTWNKSPNLMMNLLFPGVWDIAKATGVTVAPVATHREGGTVYSILDECFDITEYSREEGMRILRDKLSTLRWELVERYSQCKREALPTGKEAEKYWKNYVDSLMAEVEFYDYQDELSTAYMDRSITEPSQVIHDLKKVTPSHASAFLYDKRNCGGITEAFTEGELATDKCVDSN